MNTKQLKVHAGFDKFSKNIDAIGKKRYNIVILPFDRLVREEGGSI